MCSEPSMILVPYCPFCGATNAIGSKKYPDRCEDCGKRYHRYTSYKSQQKRSYNAKREQAIQDLVDFYYAKKRQGYKVPKDIP